MDEDFNMSIRKFLKRLGVTGQQEIERAVREAVADGSLERGATVKLEASIRIEAIGLDHRIEGEIQTRD